MSVGDYEQLENERRRAWKLMMRSAWASEEHDELSRQHTALAERRDQYLRALLAQLPFRWHVAHAYTPNETATHGGADHVVVDEPVHSGRLKREPGDALSRPRKKFWGLHDVEEGRLPSSIADIKIAERIVAAPQTAHTPKKARRSAKQLGREIAEVLGNKTPT